MWSAAVIEVFLDEVREAGKVRGLITEEHIAIVRSALVKANDAAAEYPDFVDVWDNVVAVIGNRDLSVKERLTGMGRIGELLGQQYLGRPN
jgi:hypothetical protein